jgi:hypothetical protein
MSCKVTSGTSNTCADLRKVSGLGKDFWIGYKSDLDTQISTTQSADISQLDFGSYGGLYKFEGSKFAHDFTWELAVASGGNKSFTHTLNVKVTPGTTAEDAQLQNLLLGDDIFAVVEDLNKEFYILGAGNGLSSTAASGGSGGKESGGDTADSATLTGNETTKPLRFALAGGYQATRDYIVSRQV